MKTACILILALSLLACSCGATGNFRKPYGDRVTLTLRRPSIHDGEALAVSDSLLYLEEDEEICAARLSDAKRVFVHGYDIDPISKGFWGLVLFASGVGSGILILSDSDLTSAGFIIATIDMSLGVGAAKSCVAPDDEIVLFDLTDAGQLEQLRGYCRYPQGLTAEQLAALLESRGQTALTLLPRQ